jgi:hypothetical protein
VNLVSARALDLMLDGWRSVASTPAYQALADRIRLLILDGRIGLDVRLPPSGISPRNSASAARRSRPPTRTCASRAT